MRVGDPRRTLGGVLDHKVDDALRREVTVGRDQEERVALVALMEGAKDLGLTQAQLRARFNKGDLPSAVLASAGQPDNDEDALFSLANPVTEASSAEMRERLLAAAAKRLAAWERAGHEFVAFFEDDYPPQLATAYDNPFILFYAGTLADDFNSISIVGSREPSESARRFAASLANIAAGEEVTVVSGLALGIDRAAHEAALDAGGRTVAVIGTGLDRFYPPEHEALQRRIMTEGLVVSQFFPGSGPTKATFPMRNATMSAYSALTVIVEAREKSGTRIQAERAVKHGRPLVLTQQVVRDTTWGRKYFEEGYDVAVVTTPEEAMAAARNFLARPSRVLKWARAVAVG